MTRALRDPKDDAHARPKFQDLTKLNTLRLSSQSPRFMCLNKTEDLESLSKYAATTQERVQILGGGSNVVLPAHVGGLVVHPTTKGIEILAKTPSYIALKAQAGETWHGLVAFCVARGWGGLENLAMIPGSVGAAPVQNIGAYGVELSDLLYEVQAWDVQRQSYVAFSNSECTLTYRSSRFKEDSPGRWVITAVTLRPPLRWLPKLNHAGLNEQLQRSVDSKATLSPRQVFEAVCAIRTAKLPDVEEIGNVGSFFKNPIVGASIFHQLHIVHPNLPAYAQMDGSYKLAAAWLIDQGGWKGFRNGSVGLHSEHALVMVNHGIARACDIMSLANTI